MKKNCPAYYAACDSECAICGVKLCCHYEGQACEKGQSKLVLPENFSHFGFGFKGNDNHHQLDKISKVEQKKIEKYFRENNIYSITLVEDKLLIIYNDNRKETILIDNQQLQLIKTLAQEQDNKTLN